MTDPTTLDGDAIRARADAATPGPWHGPHDGLSTCVRQGDYGWVAPGPGPEYDSDTEQGINDAEFIAHARTDVPALLAEVERLTALTEGGEWQWGVRYESTDGAHETWDDWTKRRTRDFVTQYNNINSRLSRASLIRRWLGPVELLTDGERPS